MCLALALYSHYNISSMKKLYFARHGLSEYNKKGLLAGRTETPLTTEGRQQAKEAGKKARKFNLDAIASSPQGRALETARIIAKEAGLSKDKILVNSLLAERHFGELEGKPWAPDLNLDGLSDVESEDTLMERARLALEWLENIDADNILVVSHGSFGRALRSLILAEYPFSHPERLTNAEIALWKDVIPRGQG